MKIGVMTRWNIPSGQSAHAEPVARLWLQAGHELKVFAAKGLDTHLLLREDETYVHRCFVQDVWGQREKEDYFFDPRPYLEEDYEIFVMEMAYLMPMPEMLEIFPQIRKKAKTVLVVHEIGLPPNPDWYKFEWDAIVCFDVRYKEFMSKAFPAEKLTIIPFPCHLPLHGNKIEARRLLGFPLDKRIVFAYGFNSINSHRDLFPVMEKLSRDYPLLFVLLTHHTYPGVETFEPLPNFLRVINEMPTDEMLYIYLHAADAYVNYGRIKIDGVGVSSSVAECLGAGCPVLVPGYCNFFDISGKEVIKYNDYQELEQRVRDVFEGAEYVKEHLQAAEEYANVNSSPHVAEQFIKLFKRVLDKPVHTASVGRT
jgi:rhodanese-related sulfurtransferase